MREGHGPAASGVGTAEDSSIVRLRDVVHAYPVGGFELRVRDFQIATGERIAVVGPSGSGKTTLLNLIAGLIPPKSGRLEVLGFRVDQLNEAERQELRLLRIGLVFQEFELLEYLDALDNVLLPYRLSPVLRLDRDVRDRAATLLRGMGMESKLDRFPGHLSQGERQRVAVARALVTNPALVLADEPTGNLDAENRDRIAELLFGYAEQTGSPLVVVTHDPELADRFTRRLSVEDLT